jgi:hypothetical protein
MRPILLLPVVLALVIITSITAMSKTTIQKNKHNITVPKKTKSVHPTPKHKKKKPVQKTKKKPIYIALPEEYCEISRCKNHPTLMIAYFKDKKGKKLELGFFHKKYYPDTIIK